MKSLTIISRRDFLASGVVAGGGLFVASAFPGVSLADSVISGGSYPGKAEFRPSAYVAIGRDGQVILTLGKSEMGQGTLTGLAQLIADELGCAWDRIRVVQARAAPEYGFPFNGFMITGGSSGLRTEWTRMREMGAAARIMLVEAAAARWGGDVAELTVANGVVSGPGGKMAEFGELAAEASKRPVPQKPDLKAAEQRTFIGASAKRLDTAQKISGRARFGIDVELPDMLTAVVVAPPRLMAPMKSHRGEKALARPGVRAVIPISTGVAIVGDHYWAVHAAREDVDIEWEDGPFASLDMDALHAGYRDALDRPGRLAETKGDMEVVASGKTVEVEVEQPYLAHACMEPMNFTVAIRNGGAEVWGPTQAQSLVQSTIADVAGLKPGDVAVHTTFLGGGFGRRSAQDFVRAAAEIAMAVEKPVKLVYSREDDMRAGRYRSFTLTRAFGSLDGAGKISAVGVKIAAPSISKWSGLKFLIRKDGVDEQAVEGLINLPYDIPNTRAEWVDHDPGVPVHFWRAVGASHNPFVIETLIDELAAKAGKDPLNFRRDHLRGRPRHLEVLARLEKEARWNDPLSPGVGRGLAIVESFESIVAEAVELRLVDGMPKVERVTCVIDCGVAVNPGQIEAQMHSSIVFGLSAFLRGEITIDGGRVEQSNFHDFEPLRMPEMPEIDVSILEGAEIPGGVGEPGLPPVLPAAANALYTLTGKRITRLPYRS